MYLKRKSLPRIRQYRGSMLVIALFVIIVLALLGVTMTRMISASSDEGIVAKSIQSVQHGECLLHRQSVI